MSTNVPIKNEIVQLHNEVTELAQTTVLKAARIGELLTQQKKSLPHGEFGQWISNNLPFTDRTARSYMAVHTNLPQIEAEGIKTLSGAYKMLNPKTESVSDLPEKPDNTSELMLLITRMIREGIAENDLNVMINGLRMWDEKDFARFRRELKMLRAIAEGERFPDCDVALLRHMVFARNYLNMIELYSYTLAVSCKIFREKELADISEEKEKELAEYYETWVGAKHSYDKENLEHIDFFSRHFDENTYSKCIFPMDF